MKKNAMTAVGAVVATVVLVLSAMLLPFSPAGATGDSDEPCVPVAAYTETTDWVLSAPEDDGWYQVDERVVVDKAAYDEQVLVTPAVEAQHYSWTGGPIKEGTNPPVPPAGSWQANTEQEPHTNGNSDKVTWIVAVGFGLHYTGEPGKANWFYYQPAVPAVYKTVHHEAVTHKEFKFAYDHPAVECPETETPETPTETPSTTPVTPETPSETPTVNVPTETPTVNVPPSETPQETPSETPVTSPEQPNSPDKDKDEPVKHNTPAPQPPKDVQVIACVDGVWTTQVNGQTISESGSCVEDSENTTFQTFEETGL